MNIDGALSAYVLTGYNGYTAASAALGGTGNKTSLVPDYVSGPLGRFYHPTTGSSSSLTNLLDAGSVTNASTLGFYHYTTLTNGTREGTGRLDIGFHSPLATGTTALADSDQDGLSDFAEDTTPNGTVDTGETDWQNADSDQDGALDGEEVLAGTDPKSAASWFPKRLAAWWWDSATGDWKNGDRGQTPLVNSNGIATNGIVAGGVYFPTTPTSGGTPLRYAVRESNGRLNARLDHGTLKLWFKPDWVWSNHPNGVRLFEVGNYGDTSTKWWSWMLYNLNSEPTNGWKYKFMQNSGSSAVVRFNLPLVNPQWESSYWHQAWLSYDTNRSAMIHNGARWTSTTTNSFVLLDEIPSVAYQTTNGFALGSDTSGAYGRLGAAVDGFESFNYPHDNTEVFQQQQLTWLIVTNGGQRQLQFRRPLEEVDPFVSTYWQPWPLTLWRRNLGGTNWGTYLFTNSIAATWTDTNVTVGTTYEYKAQLVFADAVPTVRHFFAGLEMPPQHQRGNVILVVDSTLEPYLTNEIATLKTNLVGDGWTVTNFVAPRHSDLNWSVNTNNLPTVAANIVNAAKTGTTNVVFILGHVTIPYSGMQNPDGHGDHINAWVADAYYGYLSKTGWTDSQSRTNSGFTNLVNVPGDGKFDPDYLVVTQFPTNYSLGRLPDMAVGRLDFAKLPVFADATWISAVAKTNEPQREVELIRMYLAKNWRYRTNGPPTFGRVSAGLFNDVQVWAAQAAQSFAGAAFGVEPGRVFNGYNLLDRVPADLAVHYHHGGDAYVADGVHTNFYLSTNFVSQAQEIPAHFRQVWFSYASDWARLNALNQFDKDDNWLRASLGWTNYGLATMGGTAWDFAPLGGGAPLAASMTHGWEGQSVVHRFQSILGDPTLRLFRVTPPSSPTATRNGSTVTLRWNPSPDVNRGYFVYRSTNGLDGFSTPLNSTPIPALSYTDTTMTTNLTYQVRAAKLQTTGSGSFTNLSQGIFIQVP